MMWLLAESWGRVTPSGTWLPIKLTHSTLGELIGAKRPTVSLALRDLIQGGAVQAQSDGWLLLSEPPAPTTVATPAAVSVLVGPQPQLQTQLQSPGR
jgi:hypothetical protein